MRIYIKDREGNPLTCAHPGDAGIDLAATEPTVILPGETGVVSVGAWVNDLEGLVGMVCSRSGLAARGVWVANAPGIVDSGFEGEIKVILYNSSREPFWVKVGDRVGQLVVVPFVQVPHALDGVRGEGGFGSTGS